MPVDAPTKRRPKWLPNALVILRLVLAALFVALLSLDPLERPAQLVGAAVLFILAALTDMLDGHLARAWDAISRFGRVMDPFADKVLVLGAFICLAGPAFHIDGHADLPALQASGVHPWMVVIIVGRELLITSLRALAEGAGQDFSAIGAGKLKMIVQSGAVPVILLALASGAYGLGEHGRWIAIAAAWITVVVTVLSGVPYIRRAFARPPLPPEPTE